MDGYFCWTSTNDAHTLREARNFFNENGYVVFTSHATKDETAALRAEAQTIMKAFYDEPQQASIFSTDEETQKRVVPGDYFLRSATKVRCFLEENQPPQSANKPAINKIGHALHELHAPFKSFSRSENTRRLAAVFGFEHSLLVQSMYILKNAHVGGAVTSHRDATFVRAASDRAEDCFGLWWALEPSTLQNGCLWVVPGSQGAGTPARRMIVGDDGHTSVLGADEEYAETDFVALPMSEGDVVVIHGGVVHRSLPNESGKSRHAYSVHLIRGGLAADCWLSVGAGGGQPFRAL